MAAVLTYLKHLHIIHQSGIASDERSYYPALDGLFNSIGATLAPKVVAIHDIADQGAGHPDYALQVEQTKDLRAAIEAKPTFDDIEIIMQSGQVKRYLERYSITIVTNLREFALVRLGKNQQVETVMRYALATDEATFWRTSPDTLSRQHQEGLIDFLISALTWDAPITRSKDLADALARYAREALRRINLQSAYKLEHLRSALSEVLGLHFSDEQGEHFFHSSLIQTLFYGLFSAWVVWNRKQDGVDQFRWREAGDYLSLPIMRELFEHIAIPSQLEMLDIRKPLEWAEATLRRTVWEKFAVNFDQADAVNYFYEPFLEAYDPQLREQLGVWYTPREIIHYQVARIHRLLREELGILLGLADEQVIVFDPATGTGGYLLETLRVIDETLLKEGWGAMRGIGLRSAAVKRVFGFEILPAPFIVAHLQIATLLADREATLGPDERAGVYLTNSLIGWKTEKNQQPALPGFPALKGEAEAAATIKHEAKILVILGNPPYHGQAGVAEDEEHELIAPYYVGVTERYGVRVRGINELYVRFLRLAERQIAETSGKGIISYITNNSWLDGLSHPVLREHMVTAFDRIWIDNLNGGGLFKGSRGPDGKPDRSAFEYVGRSDITGITLPTAITCMVKTGQSIQQAQVYYRNLWGQGYEKRQQLANDAQLPSTDSQALYQSLMPTEKTRFILMPGGTEEAYNSWPLLPEIFPVNYGGVKTSRDPILVAFDRETLERNMRQYYDPTLSDEQIAQIMPQLMETTTGYNAITTRTKLLKIGFKSENIKRFYYRPMDLRWIYWEGTTNLLDRKRADFFAAVFPGNLFFEARQKQPKLEFDRTMVTPFLADNVGDGLSSYFPLLKREKWMDTPDALLPNINLDLLYKLRQAWQVDDDLFIAEQLFFHTVAITQSPLYRAENNALLCQNWPRIALPGTLDVLNKSAAQGRLVANTLRSDIPFAPPRELHNLAIPKRNDNKQFTEADFRVTVRYDGKGRYNLPVKESEERTGRLWWNETCYWENIPPEIWNFKISGYPVIKKWLGYRHIEKLERALRYEEIRYVTEMVQRIAVLIALGSVLDENYLLVKANTMKE